MIGVIGFFGGWYLALTLTEADSHAFWSLPSLLVVTLTPAFLLSVLYGGTGMLNLAACTVRPPSSDRQVIEAVSFLQLAAALYLATGFITTLIGLILRLSNLGSPARLGPAMASSLLGQLYGVLFALVCLAFAATIARRHHAAVHSLSRRAVGVAGIATVAGTLTTLILFGILMLSLAPNL
jgi:flagellar motor component MotA